MSDCAVTEAYRIGTSSIQELPILVRGLPELMILLAIGVLGILIGMRMMRTNTYARWLILAGIAVLLGSIIFYALGMLNDCERQAIFTTSNMYGSGMNAFIKLNMSENMIISKGGYLDISATNYRIDCRGCVMYNISTDKHRILFNESGSAYVYTCPQYLVIDMDKNRKVCKDV
ncbi:hypothetical protein H6504_01755 [Candidatus Woesearchaeota archaeon]|nr:hypothetical protein [Candidatus Woesearchaeota archaeon]